MLTERFYEFISYSQYCIKDHNNISTEGDNEKVDYLIDIETHDYRVLDCHSISNPCPHAYNASFNVASLLLQR